MRPLLIGQARRAFAQPTHCLPIALEHIMGDAHEVKRPRLKRIEADVYLKYLDSSCVLARTQQDLGVSIFHEIGIEREGSLEFGEGGVVPALENQDMSKLSASLRQEGVEVHRRLRQFKGAIERGGTEIIAIGRIAISIQVSPGQHRGGAR